MQISWIGSPNYDTKRVTIDRIVIHWFGVGKQLQADAQFQKANGTSAHYSVEDNSIHQYVKEENVAYHAGNYPMNQRSIGIEHSAEPNRPATEETYQTSGKLIAEICARHNIPMDRTHIIKHSEVPRATQCPGTIDIDKLISIAKQGGQNMPNMYKGLDLSNTESMKVAVDAWADLRDGKLIKATDAQAKLDEAVRVTKEQAYNDGKAVGYSEGKIAGYNEGLASIPSTPTPGSGAGGGQPQPIDLNQWDQNGLTVETTKGDTKTIVNYKRK